MPRIAHYIWPIPLGGFAYDVPFQWVPPKEHSMAALRQANLQAAREVMAHHQVHVDHAKAYLAKRGA